MPLLRRLSASNTPFKPFDHSDWRIYFYFISQLAGGFGLTALLLTMLWPTKKRKCVLALCVSDISLRKVKAALTGDRCRPRNPLLISLCFSWWVSTFPCLCLLCVLCPSILHPLDVSLTLADAGTTPAR